MHSRTIATLDELRRIEWFSNIGVADTKMARVLSTWDEAIASCASPEWEDLCLEAANQYRGRLAERSPSALAEWNETVGRVKPQVQSLVHDKTRAVVEGKGLPRVFSDSVDWDILHLCMEAEFADLYPPGFYASQGYWYAQGHFPCGWEGAFPVGGRIVVF
ncbi:hypothetical protein [Allosphingosinicella deserti]|uniref:Uncharacterized protein n=1 Tax=Allosphingosinicella deserti TaxID=2116704 RepID=A0A2P7QWA4_9SPHN|nr:hypothetical protein [Sphingomonas deserti]PSJ42234.1 hypothetical protein C7I55_08360 [Sphingomonas deserti]